MRIKIVFFRNRTLSKSDKSLNREHEIKNENEFVTSDLEAFEMCSNFKPIQPYPSTSGSTEFCPQKLPEIDIVDRVNQALLNFSNKFDKIIDGVLSSARKDESRHLAFFAMLGEQLDKLSECDMEEIKMEILLKVHNKHMERFKAT